MASERNERLFELADPQQTHALGIALGKHLRAGDGVALTGEIGSGKTSITRGIAQGLEVDEPEAVTSPTYLMVVEHAGPVPLVHIDAYLPDKTRGFLLDGGVDYLGELQGVVVVEWADRIRELLPDHTLWIELEHATFSRRARLSGGDRFDWIRSVELPRK